MDIFILPSRFEGLPMCALEAQVSGLFTIVSNNVTEETECSSYFGRLPLNLDAWIEMIEKIDLNYAREDLNQYLDIEKQVHLIWQSNLENIQHGDLKYMEDLISVIIPVYNVEPYLERCMNSILHQTYENLEIILVDDKSTDRSNEMCLEYLADKRVRIGHGIGEGLSGARNSGLDIATGKYVVFVDSDDYAELTMIENLYHCLLKTNADTVIGGFRRKKVSI